MEERHHQPETYSTRAAARILAVAPDRIRYWVKRRVVKPVRLHGRRYRFAFNDLLVMRLTKELSSSHRRLYPIRRCFERLDLMLDAKRPVTSLKFFVDGGRIVIHDGRIKFEADSGQVILDFDVDRFARETKQKVDAGKVSELADQAARLEQIDAAKAIKVYSTMADNEPRNLHFRLRLGDLMQRTGNLRGALRQYLYAATIAPKRAETHLSLGMIHRRRDHAASAVKSMQRAVAIDPDLVAAHRELAELYEELGRGQDALRHLNALHRLTQSS